MCISNVLPRCQTESPLMIRPFLNDMTRSELHAVMTGGFATIAGSVFGAYIAFGVGSWDIEYGDLGNLFGTIVPTTVFIKKFF